VYARRKNLDIPYSARISGCEMYSVKTESVMHNESSEVGRLNLLTAATKVMNRHHVAFQIRTRIILDEQRKTNQDLTIRRMIPLLPAPRPYSRD
jgi:hypothetical protein